ncbi:kinase-like domain-containing protein [Rhizophagus clarus]|uniref:Kinase-like domain-containing protein n=1 Tax=Rhizophagus clarus TaxID=94130 RepID=A0A8H3QBL2_9GLOM|nr:kinase-like domain-containing protein [Rhizophagus clarus]
MNELPPYYDTSHDDFLALSICEWLRPRFNMKVPQLILDLIKRCLDANPLNRPNAMHLSKIIHNWSYALITITYAKNMENKKKNQFRQN